MIGAMVVGTVTAHLRRLPEKFNALLAVVCISETAPQLVRLVLHRFALASPVMEDI